MKKRVGIITMHKIYNFGSALQAYALQHIVTALGYDAELIDYKFPNVFHGVREKGLLEKIKIYVGKTLGLSVGFKTLKVYDKFWKQFFNLSPLYDSPQKLKNNPPKYDVYVTGSDQVWNTDYTKNDYSFLLDFIHNVKKIAYAPSFSKNTIDTQHIDSFKRYLTQYDSLSVREKSGVNIVSELVQKNCSVVLDPTLLVTKEQWNKVADTAKDNYKGKKYILLYIQKYSFDPSSAIVKLVKRIQQKLNIPVVAFRSMEHVGLSCEVVDGIGPVQFLHLVRNASYIVTASFHGTAFAINYGIPFSTMIKSESFNDDRQLNLVNMFELKDRMVRMDDDVDNIDLSMSYDRANDLLAQWREHSMNYLQAALRE